MAKRIKETKQKEFILVNEYNQVYSGLKVGYPNFSNDWNEARSLTNNKQLACISRGTLDKLEVMFLD